MVKYLCLVKIQKFTLTDYMATVARRGQSTTGDSEFQAPLRDSLFFSVSVCGQKIALKVKVVYILHDVCLDILPLCSI